MNNEKERNLDRDMKNLDKNRDSETNPDPITGQPGAHPVGTGAGAAAFGVIGTAIGAIGGPVGGVVGAAVGSVIGGLVGKSTAEAFDPSIEEAYWRSNYSSRPYVKPDQPYDHYNSAYRTGYEGYDRYRDQGTTFDQIEPSLRRDYESYNDTSKAPWDDARYAVRDAWDRRHYSSRWQDEDQYWQQNYSSQPYYEQGSSYNDYRPAYQYGYEGYRHYGLQGRSYDEVEPELRRDYESNNNVRLSWEKAKHAVRQAWDKVENSVKHR